MSTNDSTAAEKERESQYWRRIGDENLGEGCDVGDSKFANDNGDRNVRKAPRPGTATTG